MIDDYHPSGELVDYYREYAPARFGKLSRRSHQLKAKRFRLPLIRTGKSSLVDPVAADARLREHALHRDAPRRRGRPRAA